MTSQPSNIKFERWMFVRSLPNGKLDVNFNRDGRGTVVSSYVVDSTVPTARNIEEELADFKAGNGEPETGYLSENLIQQFISENSNQYTFKRSP